LVLRKPTHASHDGKQPAAQGKNPGIQRGFSTNRKAIPQKKKKKKKRGPLRSDDENPVLGRGAAGKGKQRRNRQMRGSKWSK